MHRDSFRIAGMAVISSLVPLLAFEYLLWNPHLDHLLYAPIPHAYVAASASLVAALAATVAGVVAERQRNLQVMFLSMAFMSLGFIFALHGFSAPGLLWEAEALSGISGPLSLLLTAFWITLSMVSTGARGVRWISRWHSWLVPAWAGVMVAVVVASVLRPSIWDVFPVPGGPLHVLVSSVSIGLFAWSGVSYMRVYRQTGSPVAKAVVYASGWLAVSQWIVLRGTVWHLSWWMYHFLLLGAAAVTTWGVWRQYAYGDSLMRSVAALFRSDALARFETGIADNVRALVLATEMRDPYTAGHSYRVTLMALRMGQAMGLSPGQLQALAQAGLVHDVGKLRIPDHILNKPGPLTPEERRIIEEHPVTGYEICSRLGFMPEELEVIRSHHERWDGTGYPDRLKGEQIPLLARILSVADVYDALTSRRAYREPWTHEQAREYVLGAAGTQFDPHCVAVFAKLTSGGPPEATFPRRVRFWKPAEQ
ncbi:MAG: HD-GYP domain-containing protein [Bacillota bacterium]